MCSLFSPLSALLLAQETVNRRTLLLFCVRASFFIFSYFREFNTTRSTYEYWHQFPFIFTLVLVRKFSRFNLFFFFFFIIKTPMFKSISFTSEGIEPVSPLKVLSRSYYHILSYNNLKKGSFELTIQNSCNIRTLYVSFQMIW